jgi:hypothetical protein
MYLKKEVKKSDLNPMAILDPLSNQICGIPDTGLDIVNFYESFSKTLSF